MKKELKRYMVVEYMGYETREYDSAEEYKNLLKVLKKYNSNDKNPYLFGNVECKILGNKYYVTVQKYHKLTGRMQISTIDDMTFDMNQIDLINYFEDKIKTKKAYIPDINIAYLNDRDNNNIVHYDLKISYLPILYRDDAKYMSKKYVMSCVKYALSNNDYGFFLDLANKFEAHKIVEEDIEKLRVAINKVRYQNIDNSYISNIVSELYDHLVYERDKDTRVLRDNDGNILKSHRRIRDFGAFVRDYAMLERKKSSPVKYNKKMVPTDEEEYSDALQEEYALFYWDQEEGNGYKDFEVSYNMTKKRYEKR